MRTAPHLPPRAGGAPGTPAARARARRPRAARWLRRAAAALALGLAPPGAVGAQAPLSRGGGAPPGAPAAPEPILFSISGGISLGSYQAGMNWGLLELYRSASADTAFARRFGIPRVSLGAVAGASAGNINTLLWAIEACTKRPAQPPDSSLFWQVWTSVGMPQLLRRRLDASGSERSLFDRRFYKDSIYPPIRERLKSPDLQAGCTVRVGVTLTSHAPDSLKLGDLSVLTQRFATAFTARVDSAPGGGPRMVFTWPDSTTTENKRYGKLVLPVQRGGYVADSAIFEIVEASSAFPLAFQPKSLTLYHPQERQYVPGRYLDGGVFDNNPVSLALNLYSDANPQVLTDGRRDTVSVIYVTPGRYRDSVLTARAQRTTAVASGGLRATMQMLGGAVQSARQYELQLAAREDLQLARSDSVRIRLTSRAHPILGEHLSAFGAFLARPFREYDFVVGMYDAMHFVAWEYTCRSAAGRRELRTACAARTIAAMIRDRAFDLGTTAPPLLAALFAEEFGHAGGGAAVEATAGASSPPRGRLGDSARAEVLLALHAAQRTQRSTEPVACGNRPLPDLLVCNDRLDVMLDAFATAPVRATTARWWKQCRDNAKHLRRVDRANACQDAEEFHALVVNPNRFAGRMLDRLFERLWDVEHAIHVDNLRLPPDGLRKGDRLDAEMPAAMLMALYRARPLRPRYGFEWSPSSAPERARWARALVPYQVAFNVGDSGFEFGYRPTWHFSREVALTIPLTAHWTTRVVEGAGPEVMIGRGHRWFAGGGLGLAARGVLPRSVGLFVPEFGATTQLLTPATGGGGRRAVVTEVYGDVSMLAGRLRVAARHADRSDLLFDGSRWAWSVGLADVTGLAYWLTRLGR